MNNGRTALIASASGGLGPEAYVFTALTASTIAGRVPAGELAVGFQTPAQLFGSNLVLEIEGVTREDVGS